MQYPSKIILLEGIGFVLEKPIHYQEFSHGQWYLQLQTLTIELLPSNISAIAQISSSFVKSVERSVYGNFLINEAPLQLININTADGDIFLVNLPTTKFQITDPTQIFKITINSQLAPEVEKACKVSISCLFFNES